MKTGRIAIPSTGEGGLKADRAGRFGGNCLFTLVDIDDGKIKRISTLENHSTANKGCIIPVDFLARNNVTTLILDGIGKRQLMICKQMGIDVYFDDTAKDTDKLIESLLYGNLVLITENRLCGGNRRYSV